MFDLIFASPLIVIKWKYFHVNGKRDYLSSAFVTLIQLSQRTVDEKQAHLKDT